MSERDLVRRFFSERLIGSIEKMEDALIENKGLLNIYYVPTIFYYLEGGVLVGLTELLDGR